MNRRGSILIIVMVTVVVLALSAYTFTALMQVHDESSRVMSRRLQSKYLAESGMEYVRMYLSQRDEVLFEKGGIWDNAENFQQIPVAVDQNNDENYGFFTILAPSMDQDDGTTEGFRYGVFDECNKLNLNTLPILDTKLPGAGRNLLMALPEMNEEIADAILDWMDLDDDIRDFGTESAHYNSLEDPYDAKNGPMDSLDELLLVKGVTPQLMFGLDSNRNGIIDPAELLDTDASSLDEDMLLGWANYLTLYSRESNLNEAKLPLININGQDLQQLYDDLRSVFDENWSRFIINYRINGPYSPTDAELQNVVVNGSTYPIDLEATPNFTFNNVLDLIDAYTTGQNPTDLNSQQTTLTDPIMQSPIRSENLPFVMPIVMRSLTTMEGESIPGRINIMQAPRRILEGIPGMSDELIEVILELREFELDDPNGVDENRKYETWLLVEGHVDLATMRDVLLPFICTGGDVYRAEIVGYFNDGVGSSRAEVILDTTSPIPTVLFWRDKSHLPGGYSLETLGQDLAQ